MKRIVISTLLFVLSACVPQPRTFTQASTATSSPSPRSAPSPIPSSTLTPSPAPTATLTPLPAPTGTPFWGTTHKYDECSGCTQASDGEILIELKPREIQANLYFWDGLHEQHKRRAISLASFQADLAVSNTGYNGPSYATHLDLHGIGTVQSWYAQIGYTFSNGDLNVYCQAFSYNSDTPRFWKEIPASIGFDEWHTFKIEVVETEVDWHYAFRYWYDGKQLCYFQPPDKWDGDNRYRVIFQDVEIYRADVKKLINAPIHVRVRNPYLFISN